MTAGTCQYSLASKMINLKQKQTEFGPFVRLSGAASSNCREKFSRLLDCTAACFTGIEKIEIHSKLKETTEGS